MSERPKLLRVLDGEALSPPPIWIMRQAGRYLPEYRETRQQAGSFLDLCYTPEMAAEVTLQPVRRFDFDAAILFSDILVVPDLIGQHVDFIEGRGPVLAPLPERIVPEFTADGRRRAEKVWTAVQLIRAELAPDKALIGFCGAPWTVATYMIAGHGTPDQMPARRMALEHPARFAALIDVLVEVSAAYLIGQIEAGADVVKIFDSWAGVLDADGFARWAVEPVRRIVERVRAAAPQVRIIGFAKGAGMRLAAYARDTGVDAVAVDWTTPLAEAAAAVDRRTAIQGNLDPLRLVLGGDALDEAIDAICDAMRGRPHIFNLGHGITPDTPIDNVTRLVERVRRRAA